VLVDGTWPYVALVNLVACRGSIDAENTGDRNKMGWKGVKRAFPAKGLNLWSLKRKTPKHGLVIEEKNQSG